MPPAERPVRRSPRILGEPAPVYTAPKRTKSGKRIGPCKKARPSASGCSDSKLAPHQATSTRKANILSLPDEAIELIFAYLNALDTSGTFGRPHDAFCLAVTNTRFLRLLGSPVTHVTLKRKYVFLPTLTVSHMLPVILRAGPYLRELHLPLFNTDVRFSISVFIKDLSILCPCLERLEIVDGYMHDGVRGLNELLDLSLRSLSISDPQPETLRTLVRSPEELRLTSVHSEVTMDLIPVLRLLPKKLYLELRDFSVSRDIRRCLHEVCPQIEEVTVKLKYWEFGGYDDRELEDFGPCAEYLLLKTPRNERSICRKMVLYPAEDYGTASLLRHVHPEAVVEISKSFQTYAYDGKKLYLKGLPLWDEFLSEDLSQLTEISVTYFDGDVRIHPLWKSFLAGKHFSRVWVENASDMGGLYLNAEVVQLPFECVTCTDWKWLGDVKEVRIVEWDSYSKIPDDKMFLRSLAFLLDTFRGKSVWVEDRYYRYIRLKKNVDSDIGLFDFVVSALNAFEARRGDAGKVREMVESIKWD